jgi:hypothetical protein
LALLIHEDWVDFRKFYKGGNFEAALFAEKDCVSRICLHKSLASVARIAAAVPYIIGFVANQVTYFGRVQIRSRPMKKSVLAKSVPIEVTRKRPIHVYD